GSVPPENPRALELWKTLSEIGALTDAPPEPPLTEGEVTFVGHATLLFTSAHTRLLVDPFLLPSSSKYRSGYEPLSIDQLCPNAILITHSHQDHFHLGTLLRFGPDIPIYVPYVDRESLLSIDMAYRLREIGFRSVHTLRCYDEVAVGDYR